MSEIRMPPYSMEAEQAVLGALLADPDALDRVADLKESHFFRADHRHIFEEMQKQWTAGRKPDAVTLAERLSSSVEDCFQYLAHLRSTEPSGARIAHHAGIVIEKAKKRGLMMLSDELYRLADSHQSAEEVTDLVAGKLEALGAAAVGKEPQKLGDMMTAYAEHLDALHSGRIKMISTGHRDLDNVLGGGLEPGLVVIAGRPAMGKTALGLGIARNTAYAGVSLFESLEMEALQVNHRNVSALGEIPLAWLRKPDHDHDHWDRVSSAFQRAKELNLYIDDETGLNMMKIRAKCRKVKRMAGGLQVLVIDQLNFIKGSTKQSSWEAIGEYTRALADLAKEMGIVVILLCQLSRDLERRTDKRPVLADLAASPAIEQDAAVVMFCYRDEYYHPDTQDKGVAEIIVAKSRQGKTGKAYMAYIGEQTRFADLARGWHPTAPRTAPAPSRGFDD